LHQITLVFGFSELPAKSKFKYTFSDIALLIGKFSEMLGLQRFGLYLHDYGSHMLLETNFDEILPLLKNFLK
jgi:hypothetical protein